VTTSPLLWIEGLQVRYGAIEAVTDATLSVMPGEFVGVIGSNGAGKSSTMRATAGVLKPARPDRPGEPSSGGVQPCDAQ